MAKTKMLWELIVVDNMMTVKLNDGVNRLLDMKHEKYPLHLEALKEEIDGYRSWTKTMVIGQELLN